MDFKLEICADCIESALNAQKAGADRIELCDNLYEGGTTPGYGTLVSVRDNIDIGMNVIIRPRGGDFLYNDSEYDIMRRDIDMCGESGADGIVLGILLPSGRIDVERTAKLIEMARPMSVTFHRAFDMCSDPAEGINDVIATGADRLLTSGQKNRAAEGTELIKELILKSGGKIVIMPGSGINETNIAGIAIATGAKEFHLTGRRTINSEMIFRREGISMGSSGTDEFSRRISDSEIIKSIINTLRAI